jgi:hypothetical protein
MNDETKIKKKNFGRLFKIGWALVHYACTYEEALRKCSMMCLRYFGEEFVKQNFNYLHPDQDNNNSNDKEIEKRKKWRGHVINWVNRNKDEGAFRLLSEGRKLVNNLTSKPQKKKDPEKNVQKKNQTNKPNKTDQTLEETLKDKKEAFQNRVIAVVISRMFPIDYTRSEPTDITKIASLFDYTFGWVGELFSTEQYITFQTLKTRFPDEKPLCVPHNFWPIMKEIFKPIKRKLNEDEEVPQRQLYGAIVWPKKKKKESLESLRS